MNAYHKPQTGLYAHAIASSRRRFMRTGGVAALAAMGAVTGVVGAAAAQETVPSGVAEWAAGWETVDAARFASGFTEDGILEAMPINQVVRGRDAIHADIQALFGAFSDITARMPRIIVSGDSAAAEWTFEGRYTGQLQGLPPGTGQAFAFRGVSVLELEGGMIRRNSRYFDLFSMLVQSGAVTPPPGAPGTDETPQS